MVSIVECVNSGELCDLSISEDESYVADGVLVHNCRRGQVSLSEEEAIEEGITDAPDVDPQPGFGRSPHGMAAVGRPDESGFDPAIKEVLDGKERR